MSETELNPVTGYVPLCPRCSNPIEPDRWEGGDNECRSCAVAGGEPPARCNCATFGNASHCPHHTQAEYDSVAGGEPTRPSEPTAADIAGYGHDWLATPLHDATYAQRQDEFYAALAEYAAAERARVVAAVEGLHRETSDHWCAQCVAWDDYATYPCPTVRAARGAGGGT